MITFATNMKFTAVIPARYASTRFPGKPLAMLGGKTVIQRVYEQAASVLSDVYVATDDERILSAVEAFGGRAVMTRTDHKSGTDRIEEAVEKIEKQGMGSHFTSAVASFPSSVGLRSKIGCPTTLS